MTYVHCFFFFAFKNCRPALKYGGVHVSICMLWFKPLKTGQFGWADYFAPLVSSLDTTKPSRDFYLLQHDFASYCNAQNIVDKTYRDVKSWTKMSILSTAGSGMSVV